MLKPNAVVFYVDNLIQSSLFYQDLLEIKPKESSPSFHEFTLSNGMGLGLKSKDTVEPAVTTKNGNGELAFTLENRTKVDELFYSLQTKGIVIAHPPRSYVFGYTFLAFDSDGNRLRFIADGV